MFFCFFHSNDAPEHQIELEQPLLLYYYEEPICPHSTPPHVHEHTEIVYIVWGEGEMIFPEERIRFKANDVFIVPKGTTHSERMISKNIGYMVLAIENEYPFQKTTNPLPKSKPFGFSYPDDQNVIFEFMQRIKNELKTVAVAHQKHNVNLLLSSIFIEILRKHPSNAIPTPIIEANVVYDYIITHFSEEITLQTLADLVYSSTVTLGKHFKKIYGITPMQFLNKQRIEQAKLLLRNTSGSIFNISINVGFSSPAYFAHVFMKEVGQSPTDYRNKKPGESTMLSPNTLECIDPIF